MAPRMSPVALDVPAPRAERRSADSKLARGLSLLRVFREGETELTLKQLILRAGLTAGTAHRLSRELVSLGMLDRTPGGFRPGPAMAHLALRATTWPALTVAASPAAEHLHGLSGCPVSLYLPSGAGLLPMWQLTSQPGITECRAVPATADDLSSLLPELRGSATVEGLSGGRPVLLAAIRDDRGELVAALCLTGDDGGRPRRFGPALTVAAAEIGRTLRHTSAPSGLRPATAVPMPAPPVDASVLARGVGLLGCLRPGERSVRRLDVVDRVATPRSTVYRCLSDLLRSGVLEPHEDMIGLGRLVRLLASVAIAPRLPADDRLRRLAADGDITYWLTPVDPDLRVPLNGLVVRARAAVPSTVRSRFLEWALVSASVADVFSTVARQRRFPRLSTTSVGALHSAAVPVRHAGVASCLTVITGDVRRPHVERLLRELTDQEFSDR